MLNPAPPGSRRLLRALSRVARRKASTDSGRTLMKTWTMCMTYSFGPPVGLSRLTPYPLSADKHLDRRGTWRRGGGGFEDGGGGGAPPSPPPPSPQTNILIVEERGGEGVEVWRMGGSGAPPHPPGITLPSPCEA